MTVTPRNYKLSFRNGYELENHCAVIGIAHISNDYPLYYDAANENGLCMAGLNFVGNAFYRKNIKDKENIAQYEFILWILSQCKNVSDAEKLIKKTNITDTPFSADYPVAQLHWIIADKDSAITVESVKDEIKVYDNPVGILTNNPTFDKQLFILNNYLKLSPKSPENLFCKNLNLSTYSRGMGALGLPGDLSSQSRFVRAAFVKSNSVSGKSEQESVSQFFHILNSVEQQNGCCEVSDGKFEKTIYTSCCNASKSIYYYTCYNNHQITAVDMQNENLEQNKLIAYNLLQNEQINYQNKIFKDL